MFFEKIYKDLTGEKKIKPSMNIFDRCADKNSDSLVFGDNVLTSRQVINECAIISNDVYNDKPGILPPGWKRFCQSEPSPFLKYFGAAYVYEHPARVDVIIAHRGTFSLNAEIEDLIMQVTNIVPQMNQAAKFTSDAKFAIYDSYYRRGENEPWPESVEEFYQYNTLTFTGHSLGGLLAQLTGVYDTVVAFDCPGYKEIITKEVLDVVKDKAIRDYVLNEIFNNYSKRHSIILSHVDIVNSCKTHVGNILRCINIHYNFSLIPEICLSDPFNISKSYINIQYAAYTFKDQHKMDLIQNYLLTNGILINDTSPCTLQSGYMEFLNTQRHKDYWIGYFTAGWNYLHSHSRKVNEKTLNEFLNNGFSVIENIRKKYYQEYMQVPEPEKIIRYYTNGFFSKISNKVTEITMPKKRHVINQYPNAPYEDEKEEYQLPDNLFDYEDIIRYGKCKTRTYSEDTEHYKKNKSYGDKNDCNYSNAFFQARTSLMMIKEQESTKNTCSIQ